MKGKNDLGGAMPPFTKVFTMSQEDRKMKRILSQHYVKWKWEVYLKTDKVRSKGQYKKKIDV